SLPNAKQIVSPIWGPAFCSAVLLSYQSDDSPTCRISGTGTCLGIRDVVTADCDAGESTISHRGSHIFKIDCFTSYYISIGGQSGRGQCGSAASACGSGDVSRIIYLDGMSLYNRLRPCP